LDDDAPIEAAFTVDDDNVDDILNALSMSVKNYQNSFPMPKKLNPTINYEVPSDKIGKLNSAEKLS